MKTAKSPNTTGSYFSNDQMNYQTSSLSRQQLWTSNINSSNAARAQHNQQRMARRGPNTTTDNNYDQKTVDFLNKLNKNDLNSKKKRTQIGGICGSTTRSLSESNFRQSDEDDDDYDEDNGYEEEQEQQEQNGAAEAQETDGIGAEESYDYYPDYGTNETRYSDYDNHQCQQQKDQHAFHEDRLLNEKRELVAKLEQQNREILKEIKRLKLKQLSNKSLDLIDSIDEISQISNVFNLKHHQHHHPTTSTSFNLKSSNKQLNKADLNKKNYINTSGTGATKQISRTQQYNINSNQVVAEL